MNANLTITTTAMEAAYFADQINGLAAIEECSPEQILAELDCTVEQYAEYEQGLTLLDGWDFTTSHRSTHRPTAYANQIVVDGGYIATSPAYRLVTFRRR